MVLQYLCTATVTSMQMSWSRGCWATNLLFCAQWCSSVVCELLQAPLLISLLEEWAEVQVVATQAALNFVTVDQLRTSKTRSDLLPGFYGSHALHSGQHTRMSPQLPPLQLCNSLPKHASLVEPAR